MAYTTHGWHIDGSVGTNRNKRLPNSTNCGGPEHCPKCNVEFTEYMMAGSKAEPEVLLGDNTTNYQHKAMEIVRKYVDENYDPKLLKKIPAGQKLGSLDYEVYVVWFAKTLQNWKALVATTMEDSRYYEVTYNGEKRETYLDAYTKIDNVVIPN